MKSVILAIAVTVPATSLYSQQPAQTSTSPIVEAAIHFAEHLSEEQQQRCLLPFDDHSRVEWHFIPKDDRKGLPLMDMDAHLQDAARDVLRALVSELGYEKSNAVMRLESILRELEGPGREAVRNPLKYYFTLFGSPVDPEFAISIEGHHLSLNFTLQDGKIVDSTPQFLGSNPSTLMADHSALHPDMTQGTQVLRDEEALGFDLIRSLSESQRESGYLSRTPPEEIRWAGDAQVTVPEPSGIRAGELNEDQQTLLRNLIATYTAPMRDEVAKARWEAIENNGLENVVFGWAGATEPGIGHYYCIQGKSFIIEFINVQADPLGNPANHIHCVWRDLTGDFNLPPKR